MVVVVAVVVFAFNDEDNCGGKICAIFVVVVTDPTWGDNVPSSSNPPTIVDIAELFPMILKVPAF